MPMSRRSVVLGGTSACAVGIAQAQPVVTGNVPLTPMPTGPIGSPTVVPGPSLVLVRPRLNVAGLAPNSKTLTSLRAAIAAMQALPASDPRSWEAQAQTHQNHCAHRNWYTWPWHRAFLLQFERICRTLSGDADFRVPYWDWTANPQMPAAVTQAVVNGSPNPLAHPRSQSPNASLDMTVVGTAVVNAILAEPNFEAFMSRRPAGQNNTTATWQRTSSVQGQMESNPHNTVHGWVGGDMASFLSPRDPIFWLHHANLDRLWQRWNDGGHTNTNDPLWRDFQFSGQFVTGTGTPYNPQVKSLLNIQGLGYTYPQPIPLAGLLAQARIVPDFDWGQLRRAETVFPAVQGSLQSPAAIDLQTPLALSEVTARSLAAVVRPAARDQPGAPSPVLRTAGRVLALVNASIPESASSPQVRVFLNCDYLSPDTSSADPHYVGSFSFFGMNMSQHGGMAGSQEGGETQFLLDLTRTLVALGGAGQVPTNQLRLQFQPVTSGSVDPTPVTIHRVEIAIS